MSTNSTYQHMHATAEVNPWCCFQETYSKNVYQRCLELNSNDAKHLGSPVILHVLLWMAHFLSVLLWGYRCNLNKDFCLSQGNERNAFFFFVIGWSPCQNIIFICCFIKNHWKFPLFTLCHRTQYCTHFEQCKETFNLMALAEETTFLFIIISRFSFIMFKGSLELLFIEEYSISQVGLILWQHYFSILFLMYGT